MNSWTRLAGYLGLTALLGSVAILLIVPARRLDPSPLRDQAGMTAIVGYLLIVARLFYLTFHGEGRTTRTLSALGMMLMIIGAAGDVGFAVVLITSPAAST